MRPRPRRVGPIAVLVVAVAAVVVTIGLGLGPGSRSAPGAGAGVQEAAPAGPAPGGGSAERPVDAVVEESPREDVPSALDDMTDAALPSPLVDPAAVMSGGPPPDGIPPIDEPRFLAVAEVDFLADDEPVVVLSVDGDTRAYPVQVLTWHEVVNDVVAGRPVVVTYCPLCNTALAFERTVGEKVLGFGTSGRLYLSNLLMYDRQTESLWPQAEGRAVAGVLTGTELDRLPVALLPWEQFRDAFPDALVLSRDTGALRDYGRNPYQGYDDVEASPFLFRGEVDPRLPAMARVVGLGDPSDPVAVVTDELLARGVVELQVSGEPVLVLGAPGQASALDTPEIADGADVGTTGAFAATLDGRTLTLRPGAAPGQFVDDVTGSTWDVQGRAVAGAEAGRQLQRLASTDTFWFSWQSFWPDTLLVP
ncbi:DUF3179 domain-containing protein [Aquipuribacter nitratireducens]|uniref:DUF3179 domain-containing protein n=1 Tax=Aquipuribacter nitratireducens TaxID=650104 RepID=A0ABW0GPY3_9MICO